MENCIIKHVHIEGLWNKYTVDFPLDEDVNILVGNNGVGKTTILNIIIGILYIVPAPNVEFRMARIDFSDDYYAVEDRNNNTNHRVEWYHKGESIEHLKPDVLNFASFATFDKGHCFTPIQARLRSLHEDINTELDSIVYQRIESYYRYKSTLGSILRSMVEQGKMEEATSVFALSDKAKNICNELFSDKIWFEGEETDGKLLFKTKEDGVVLKPSQLSSGEKQLLALLLTTLVTNGNRFIALWDEPEISLHIDWQERLISTMRELNPNMQLIIATHSPSILFDGWERRAINVNSIKTKA